LAALRGGIDGSGREHGKIDDGIADAEIHREALTAAVLRARPDIRNVFRALVGLRGIFCPRQTRTLDALVVATDVYVRKPARRDVARSCAETARIMRMLVDAVLKQASSITAKGSTSS
jgi:hypothetical protein